MIGTTARSQNCTNKNNNGGNLIMKYSENIMRMVRGNLDLELDDTNRDGEIEVMSKREVFNRVYNWDGLIDYGDTIIKWINQIYGVDLNKMEE